MIDMLTKRISKHTIEEMLHLANITATAGRELGFPLCDINGKIERSTELSCVGEKCWVKPSTNCGKNKMIGLFHTHPPANTISMPSFADIKNAYVVGLDCIGNKSKRYGSVVACNERKAEFNSNVHSAMTKGKNIWEGIDRIDAKKTFLRNYFTTTLIARHPKTKDIIGVEYKY